MTPPASPDSHPRDPLHGITLEMMVTQLFEQYGWEEMGDRIPIRCFIYDPTIKSSLAFLRRTPWARKKVEDWYRWEFRKAKQGRSTTPTEQTED